MRSRAERVEFDASREIRRRAFAGRVQLRRRCGDVRDRSFTRCSVAGAPISWLAGWQSFSRWRLAICERRDLFPPGLQVLHDRAGGSGGSESRGAGNQGCCPLRVRQRKIDLGPGTLAIAPELGTRNTELHEIVIGNGQKQSAKTISVTKADQRPSRSQRCPSTSGCGCRTRSITPSSTV